MTVAPDIRICGPDELATVAAALIAAELRGTIRDRAVARIAVAGGRPQRRRIARLPRRHIARL